MSSARKCDRCGALYEVAKGVVALDVHIAQGGTTEAWAGWNEVDFCERCSVDVLKAIGKAIRR